MTKYIAKSVHKPITGRLNQAVSKVTVDMVNPHEQSNEVLKQCDSARVVQHNWKRVKA